MNFRPKKFTEDMLVDGFKTHGDIKGVQIFRSNGYIHFQKYYDGANALKSMHGKNLYGARLEVAHSRLPWDVICKRHRNHVKKKMNRGLVLEFLRMLFSPSHYEIADELRCFVIRLQALIFAIHSIALAKRLQ